LTRVLVTRPQPGAARTARRLADLGHRPVELPLTETVPLAVDTQILPASFDIVAVTSANALRHASLAIVAPLAGKPCFAVGARTATVARDLGFRSVEEGSGNAADLAAHIVRRTDVRQTVVYLCGRVRLGDFEGLLADAARTVVAVETYDTRGIDYSPENLAAITGTEPFGAVLLYSANAAELFAGLHWPGARGHILAEAKYLCLSPRVAERLGGVDQARILVASEPSEAALLGLLRHVTERP
jgi:uroporphyrinogen-III synthase